MPIPPTLQRPAKKRPSVNPGLPPAPIPSAREILSKAAPLKSSHEYEKAWAWFKDFLNSPDYAEVKDGADAGKMCLFSINLDYLITIFFSISAVIAASEAEPDVLVAGGVVQSGGGGVQSKGESEAPTKDDYIRFFHYLRTVKDYECTSIWSMHSRLNNCHQRLFGFNIKTWPQIKLLLQSYEVGYVPKKASIFSLDQIEEALQLPLTAPKWILRKAGMAIAYCGGLRGCELRSIKLKDVQEDAEAVWIDYDQGKQRGMSKRNGFLVPFNRMNPKLCFATRVIHYRNELLRSVPNLDPEEAFFRRALKNGISRLEVMGRTMLGTIGKDIASELNLAEPKTYTGHCFRRSFNTAAAEAGATVLDLMTSNGWKNPKTAMEYIDGTKGRKRRMSKLATGVTTDPSGQNALIMADTSTGLGGIGSGEASRSHEPTDKKARLGECPENVKIISGNEDLGEDEPTKPGQKIYKVDLRGASNFTLKFN